MIALRVTPQQIRAIHVLKTRAKLDDISYRELLSDFGVTSSTALSRDSAERLLERMQSLPGVSRTIEGKGATGPYAAKLQALWIAGWNLGVVRDRTDAALHAFVKRQTGLDHTRFLREHKAAARAIEALKDWLSREAGVEWPKTGSGREADVLTLKRAVLHAQCRRGASFGLRTTDLDRLFEGTDVTPEELDWASKRLGGVIRRAVVRGRSAEAA